MASFTLRRTRNAFVLVGVPAVGALLYYKERNRPKLPPTESYNLSEKTCVITGATSGIGLATAEKLVNKGCRSIVIGTRNLARGKMAAERIQKQYSLTTSSKTIQHGDLVEKREVNDDDTQIVDVLPLNLNDLSSVENFAEEVKRRYGEVGVDLLISSAAEIHSEPMTNCDNIDSMFCTNHLGMQQLITDIQPLLFQKRKKMSSQHNDSKEKETSDARVVIVGSRLENKGKIDPTIIEQSQGRYLRPATEKEGPSWKDPMQHYADTKLANQLLVTELSRQWKEGYDENKGSISIVSVSPGMVHTSLWRHFPLWYRYLTYPIRALALRDAEDAAEGVVFAATSPTVESGTFLSDGIQIEPSPLAQDATIAKQFVQVCESLLFKISERKGLNQQKKQ